MIKLTDKNEKIRIRNDMLEYCKLDTLAMVKIYKRIKKICTS